ncbi:unnamed protein product [Bursaphelenchus xylophilus]|uniref:Small ribosomal subunit protein uS13 n=1 Tax=Bursaphelenchus xylophilus TaxID=6326 RepID=A0A7I8X654_BURXY|nr:unnamed protein product [Bursaphelenchus xylophilus]CAG9122785.1 unnamed protein product [Bursaphelenchus xylophilus]
MSESQTGGPQLRDCKIPNLFLNRLKDGRYIKGIFTVLDPKLRDVLERIEICPHRGLRHYWGLHVHGQHTKNVGLSMLLLLPESRRTNFWRLNCAKKVSERQPEKALHGAKGKKLHRCKGKFCLRTVRVTDFSLATFRKDL